MAYVAPTVVASGITWAQLQAGGPSAHLELLITANSAGTLAPTAASTISATGGGSTGGLLAAGTYYLVSTETNGIGETAAGPVSAQFTVGAGNIPQVTFPALQTGNTARNIYLGAVGGASSGPFALYVSGVTTSTSNLAVAAPAGSNPPTSNTTGLTLTKLQLLRYFKTNQGEKAWTFLHQHITDVSQGEPISAALVTTKFADAATVFAILNTLCNEEGALLAANPGHLAIAASPIGGNNMRRVWP